MNLNRVDAATEPWIGDLATPNKGFHVLLRLYSPLQPWFDRTWKPGDFELVK